MKNKYSFKYKTGLAVMRAQPFHKGHATLICRMLVECENCVVLLGSMDAPISEKNPFTYTERKEMILSVFPDDMHLAGICDLGNRKLWAGYVLADVWKNFRLDIDAYYCGCDQDGGLFKSAGLKIVELSRNDIQVSGTAIRRGLRGGDESVLEHVHHVNREIIKQKLKKRSK